MWLVIDLVVRCLRTVTIDSATPNFETFVGRFMTQDREFVTDWYQGTKYRDSTRVRYKLITAILF